MSEDQGAVILEAVLEIKKSQGKLEAMMETHLENPCAKCDLVETVRELKEASAKRAGAEGANKTTLHWAWLVFALVAAPILSVIASYFWG